MFQATMEGKWCNGWLQVDEGELDGTMALLAGTVRFNHEKNTLPFTVTLIEVDTDETRAHGKSRDRNDMLILKIFDEEGTTYEYTFLGDIEIHRYTST